MVTLRRMIFMAFIGFGLLKPSRNHAAQVDFAKDIQPILTHSCIECHGSDKQKGKLRLDLKAEALKDRAIIAPGNAAHSELYKRIILPPGDDDIMPAKGEPLTQRQTDLIRDWINQGALWPDDLIIKMHTQPPPAKGGPKLIKSSPAEMRAITQLQEEGIQIRPVARNAPWTVANLRGLDSNSLAQVLPLLANVLTLQDLNLARTPISDSQLKHIAGLTNLIRLHLEKSPLTDVGLVHLKDLVNLQYLNLYGTEITDAGLDHLKNLKQLRNLFLWQTKATDAGVEKLQAALVNTDIDRGWKVAKPKTAEEEKKK